MADTIKEYVIKIRADVEEAQDQINKLKGAFESINIKNSINVDLGRQASKINGSIGQIIQQLSQLNKSFNDVDIKGFSSEMKDAIGQLKTSIEEIQKSSASIEKSFNFSDLTQKSGLTEFVESFKTQMTQLTDMYQDTVSKLQQISQQGFAIPQTGGQGRTNHSASQNRQIKQTIQSSEEFIELKNRLKEIVKKAKSFKDEHQNISDLVESVADPDTGLEYVLSDYLAANAIIEELLDAMKGRFQVLQRLRSRDKDIQEIFAGLAESGLATSKGALEKTRAKIRSQQISRFLGSDSDLSKAQKSSELEPQHMKVRFVVDYDVLEGDDKEANIAAINSIVTKIRTKVQQRVQEQINNNPIRIPISFGSYDLIKQAEKEQKEVSGKIKEITDEDHAEALVSSITVAIKANTEGLLDAVNTKIDEINSSLTKTIDVKIRPVLMDEDEVKKAVEGTEESIDDLSKRRSILNGFTINMTNSGAMETVADDRVVGLLEEIKNICSEISGKMDNIHINPPGGGGSGGGHVPPNTPVRTTTPPPGGGGGNVPPQSGGQIGQQPQSQKPMQVKKMTVDGQNVQIGQVQSGAPKSKQAQQQPVGVQTQGQQPQGVQTQNGQAQGGQVGNAPKVEIKTKEAKVDSEQKSASKRRPSNLLTDLVPGRLMRNVSVIRSERQGQISLAEQTSAKEYGKELNIAAMRALKGDIKKGTPLREIQSKNYYTQALSGNKEIALYGTSGQKLTEFQTLITNTAATASKEITSAVDKIKTTMQNELTDKELVDSGIGDHKVTKWMKRIIDDDIYQEEQDLRGNRLPKRMKKTSDKQVEEYRAGLIRDEQNGIANVAKRKSELENVLAPYLDSRLELQAIEGIQERLKEAKSREEVESYFERMAELHPDSKLRAKQYELLSSEQFEVYDDFDFDSYKSQISKIMDDRINSLEDLKNAYERNHKSEIALYDRIDEETRNAEHRIHELENASKEDVVKGQISKEHKKRRQQLAEYTGGMTDEYNKLLFGQKGIMAREISKKKEEISSKAITASFGENALKPLKKDNVSRIDIKDHRARKYIDTLEANGFRVDENNSTIYAANGVIPSTEYTRENLEQRLADVGKDGQAALEAQEEITARLAENEVAFQEYVEAYERIKAGTGTDADKELVNKNKDVIAGYLAKTTTDMDRIKAEITNANLTEIEAERGHLNQAEERLRTAKTDLLNDYKNLNVDDIYGYAKDAIEKISMSRQAEKNIVSTIIQAQTQMVRADATNIMSEKGFEEAVNRQREVEERLDQLRSMMRVTNYVPGKESLKPGERKEKSRGFDPHSVDDATRKEFYELEQENRELKRSIFGYRLAKGDISYYRGGGELYTSKSKVINLGLPDKLAHDYAFVPTAQSVSTSFTNAQGSIVYDRNGKPLLEPAVGVSAEGFAGYANTLREAVPYMEQELAKLPQTAEEVTAEAERMVRAHIDNLKEESRMLTAQIDDAIENNKRHLEEQKTKGESNIPIMTEKDIERLTARRDLVDQSIKDLEGGKGNRWSTMIEENERELSELTEKSSELIRKIMKELNVPAERAQAILDAFEEVDDAKETEKMAKRDLWQFGNYKIKREKSPDKKAINTILKNIFGDDAVPEGEFSVIDEAGYPTIESVTERYNTLVDSARFAVENRKQALEKLNKLIFGQNKTGIKATKTTDAEGNIHTEYSATGKGFLASLFNMMRDEYGANVGETEAGKAFNELMEIKERQEYLEGDTRIARQELAKMEKEGGEYNNLFQTMVHTERLRIENRKKNLQSMIDRANSDANDFDQMVANEQMIRARNTEVASLQDTAISYTEKRRSDIARQVREAAENVDYIMADPERRGEEIKNTYEQFRKEIQDPTKAVEELEQLLVEQHNKIVNFYGEFINKWKRQFPALRANVWQKQLDLYQAEDDLDSKLGVYEVTAEDIYGRDAGYVAQTQRLGAIEASISSTKEKRTGLRESFTSKINDQIISIKNDIYNQILNDLGKSYRNLMYAVNSGKSEEILEDLSERFYKNYQKYIAVGGSINYFDDERLLINGKTATSFAQKMIGDKAEQYSFTAEDIFNANPEYVYLKKQLSDKNAIFSAQTTRKLAPLREERAQVANQIVETQKGIFKAISDETFGLMIDLEDAVANNEAGDSIIQKASAFYKKYREYIALGGKDEKLFNEEDVINGISPVDFAYGQITSKEQAAYNNAQQNLTAAQSRVQAAERNMSRITEALNVAINGQTEASQENAPAQGYLIIKNSLSEANGIISKLSSIAQNLIKGLTIGGREGTKMALGALRTLATNGLDSATSKLFNEEFAKQIRIREISNDSITEQIKELLDKKEGGIELSDKEKNRLAELSRIAAGRDLITNEKGYVTGKKPPRKPLTEEQKKANAQEAARQQAADLIRYREGQGSKERAIADAAKATRIQEKVERNAQREAEKKAERLGEDYYFADMTKEQFIVSKKIQRLAAKQSKGTKLSEQEKGILVDLYQKASNLNLEVTTRGFIQPLVSEEEYRAGGHHMPTLTRNEYLNSGLMTPWGKLPSYVTLTEQEKEEERIARQKWNTPIQEPEDVGYDVYDEYLANFHKMSKRIVGQAQAMGEAMSQADIEAAEAAQKVREEAEKAAYRQQATADREAISLKDVTSREDYINRVRAGLSRGYYIGGKDHQVFWTKKRGQLDEFGYKDFTEWLKKGGIGSAISEERIGQMADYYLKPKAPEGQVPSSEQVVAAEGKQEQANNTLSDSAEKAADAVQAQAKANSEQVEKAEAKVPNRPKPKKEVDVSTLGFKEVDKELKHAIGITRRKDISEETKALWESYIEELQTRQQEILSKKYTYNGKDYIGLDPEKRKKNRERLESSEDLHNLLTIKQDSKRQDLDIVKRIHDALNAYINTGEKQILEELEASFHKDGENKMLGKDLKPDLQAFISKELGKPFVDPRNKDASKKSAYSTYASFGKEGLRSALMALTRTQLDQVALNVGYNEEKLGKLSKFDRKSQVADLIANAYEKRFGVVKVQAQQTEQTLKEESKSTGQADTSGLDQQKEKLGEVEDAAHRTSDAIDKLHDSMIVFDSDVAVDTTKKENDKPKEKTPTKKEQQVTTTTTFPVYGKNGTVVGASKRNNTPYTAEEFAANEGLAEKVLATASRATFYRGDYWEQSRANAQAYLDKLKEIKTEESKTDQSPISSDTSALPEQERAAGEAIRQTTEHITTVTNEAIEQQDKLQGELHETEEAANVAMDAVQRASDEAWGKTGKGNEVSEQTTQKAQEEANARNAAAEATKAQTEAEKERQTVQNNSSAQDPKKDALKAVIEASKETIKAQSEAENARSLQQKGKITVDQVTPYIDTSRQAQAQLEQRKAELRSYFSSVKEMNEWIRTQGSEAMSVFGLSGETAPAQTQNGAASQQAAEAAQREAEEKRNAAAAVQEHTAAMQADTDATRNNANVDGSQAATRQNTPAQNTNVPPVTTDNAISQTAVQTAGDVQTETQAIQGAGEAAAISAEQKQRFAIANGQVASSANTTVSAVEAEAQAFERIVSALLQVAAIAQSFKLNITINGIDGINEDFLKKFDQLKEAVSGIDANQFNSIGSAFDGMRGAFSKFGDAGVSTFFTDLAQGVKEFTNALNETDISDNFVAIGNMVKRISDAGRALSDAVTLIKNGGDTLKSSIGNNSYVKDSVLNNAVEEQIKELKFLSDPKNAVNAVKIRAKVDKYNDAKANGQYASAIDPSQAVWLDDYTNRAVAAVEATSSLIDKLQELPNNEGAEAIRVISQELEKYINNTLKADQTQREYGQTINEYEKLISTSRAQLFGSMGKEDIARFREKYDSINSEFERLSGLLRDEGNADDYKAAVRNLIKEWKQTVSIGKGDIVGNFQGGVDQARDYISQLINSRYKIVTEDVSGGRINANNIASFSAQVVDAKNKVNDLRISWNQTTGDIAISSSKASSEFKGKFMSLLTDLQAKSRQLFLYWTATFLNPYRLIGTVKQVINIVKQYDDALTEMRKVSDESVASLRNFQIASFDIGGSLGTTGLQIQKSTADWLRLGESLEEAQESAKVSNLLMNVSEFQSIDQATQALVASSQAYKDLDKIEIVDKLNNIGNNFSISTDQLATGLQNAAAVLMTQGNDLDEAIALLTAGNAITQDISKTSAGIRTISLRISGTEEAKDEIRDMGEDVDDFVVRTRSKTDSIIRDYTAVASNNYQGVSVLDANGNLRNTYDILLDIAKIYKEIQAEDKQRGTNRAQALVETLAGKTRSNIAASILQNPEMLEDVYEASQNSVGSAMEENLKYLDSISGKLQILTNNAQKIANLVIDSEGLKTILDIVNALVGAFAELVENVGGFNIALGAIIGIGAQMRGMGLFNYDKKAGFNIGMWGNILSNKSSIGDELNALISQATDVSDPNMLIKDLDQSVFNNLSKGLQDYLTKIKTGAEDTATFAMAQSQLPTIANRVGSAFGTATTIAGKFVSVLGNMAIATAASMAISLLIQGLVYLFTWQDKLIKKGEEAKESISKVFDSFKEQTTSLEDVQVTLGVEVEENQDIEKTISNIADKYSELHKGVNGITNENISLTNDEYQQYLDTCNKLAEQYPSLVKSWDSQNNAILDIGESANDAKEALMGMYEAQQLSANIEMGSNLQDAYRGTLQKSLQLNSQNSSYQNQIDQLEYELSDDTLSAYGMSNYRFDKNGVITAPIPVISKIQDYMRDKGFVTSSVVGDNIEAGTITIAYDFDFIGLSDKELNEINDAIANLEQVETQEKESEITELQKKQSANDLLISDQWKSLQQSVSQYLQTSSTFTGFNDQIQSAILGNLGNIDISLLKNGTYDNILSFIYGEILEPMDGLNEEVQQKLAEAFTLDTSKINRQDYVGQIAPMLQEIFGEDWRKWATQLGFQDIIDELSDAEAAIYAEFGNNLTKEQEDTISDMSIDMLRNAKRLLSERSYEPGDFSSFLVDLNKKPIKAPGTGKLTDIFNDEEYSKEASTFTSNLSEIKTAIEQVGESGSVASDEVTKLLETGVKFDSFELSGLSKAGTDVLSDWIKKLHEMAEAMDLSDDAMKDFDQYIASIVASYGNLLDIDPQKFITSVVGASLARAGEGSSTGQVVGEITGEKGLGERLQSENAEEILLLLNADGTLASGQIQQIVDQWDHYEILLNVTADAEEAERRIASLANDTAERSYREALNSSKEAIGDVLTEEDYSAISDIDIRELMTKRTNADEALEKLNGITDKNSAEYYNASADYYNALTELTNLQVSSMERVKAQQESGANAINRQLEEMENTRSALDAQITEATNRGSYADQSTYSSLAMLTSNMAKAQRDRYNFYSNLAENTNNKAWAIEWGQTAQEALNEALSLEADSLGYLVQPYVDQIDDLSKKYEDLSSEQSQIQDNLELREKKGYKTTARDYKRLLKNSKDQKKNIEEQNALLRKQLKTIKEAGGDWSDVQDQIESNNESIRGLNSSIFDYEQSIRTAALTEAQALASAIQTAMQEMASETGLSTDTILQLKQAFSDLKSMDISTLFYRTADGIKMSVNTLNTLIEAENTLKNNELDEQIRAQQEAMEKEADANGILTSTYRNMEDELLNLMNTRSQYFATYQEQLAAIDGHSLIELAKSTANPLDRYDQSREYLKEAYEMYEKGQIGSDDFKAIASYFDINGFSDEATFKANYDKYSKYFTEDATGLVTFWNDLVTSGVAAKDELGNYILTMGDVEKAAEAANVPLAVFQDIIMATNDYGADVAFVTSVQDGREQLAGLNAELRDEQVKLEQLKASGAEQSVIDKQNEVIANVKNSIANVQSATDAAIQSERKTFLEGAKNAKQLWEAYSGYRDDAIAADDIEARRFWEQMMRSLAEEYDLEIKPGFEFDQEGYDELMAEVQKEMNNTEELKIRFSVSDEDVTSAKNALDKAFNGNRQNIYEATSELRKYSAEELLTIDHADRIWSDGEKEVEEFAEALGLPLDKINALIIALKEMGMLTSDLGSEQVEEVASQPVYVNSGVNLRNRPQVSANKMRNMGYNVEEGSYATVFSSAYSNEDETKTVVVTPILPNGDILSQGTLERFAGELLEGNEISVPQVELAMFQGEDSVEQAQRYSDVLHGVQEAFSDNNLEFQALLSTINANQEGLDKVVFGDGDVAEGAEALEGALDGVLEQLGLGQEYGQALLYVLAQMGFIEMPELTTEVDVDTEGAKTEVENLDKELSEEKIEKEIVYKTNQEGPEMYSDSPLGRVVQVEGYNGPNEKKQRQIQVNVVRNKVDKEMAENGYTAQDILTNWSEQDIALNFKVNGADEIQMVKEYVAEIASTDGYDLIVHIDETQMSSLLEALNPENPIDVEVNDDPWNEFVKEVEDTDLTVTIKTKLETPTSDTPNGSNSTGNQNTGGSSNTGKSGNQGSKSSGAIIDNKSAASSVNDINNMLNSLDVGNTYITVDGAMATAQINAFNNKISNLEHGESYITIDGTMAVAQIGAFNDLITTGLSEGYSYINVDGSNAITQINKFNERIDSIHNGKSSIEVDGSNAVKQINAFNTKIDNIHDGNASVSVSGVSTAIENVKELIRQLNALNGKNASYTVTRTNFVVGGHMDKGSGALGTAHSLGSAFAFGNAYAFGQSWGVPDNEDALVNEVGQESIVRDGHWFLLPGGPHVEKLKKNDIVFNAEQTEDLIETGKTARRGKIVGGAYANGTANGMSAFAGVSGGWKLPTAIKQSTAASNQNYTASNTSSSKKSSKNTKSGLDALKEWLEKLFDWVEVRVERLEYTIDLYQAKAENNIGYAAKNKLVQSAFDTTKTLISDATKGANKYLEQAELVRKKAVQLGVVSNDASKNLVKLIQSGEIQISEYDEKTREFINDYKEWFDKSLDLTAQVEDLKTQLKELEQTKLDNITEQFEALASWSDAVSSRAQAMGEFLTSAGRVVNNPNIKNTFGAQIYESNLMIGRYQQELKAFANELATAKNVFGEYSNEYREAQAQYEEINQQLLEASTQYNELNKQLYELDLTKLEYAMDRLEQFGDKLSSIVSLKETRGTLFGASAGDIIGEADYSQQIKANNDIIKIMAEDRQKRINEIAKFGWDIDSENYKEAYDAIMNDEKEILNLLESNEKLKESIRTLRWKPFEELQKQIDEASGDYDHLRDLITDSEKFDDKDGIYMTARGYADLSLLAQQIGITQGKIADYRKALDKLQEEYKSGNISLETFNETSRDYIDTIQSSVTAVDGYKDAIIELYKTQITNENAALQDTIDLRKKALSAKKSYYDFDKTLKEKNKDIAQLRAQINALQGVTNDAAKAQRAKLQAQLAEAEEDLRDTLIEHQYEATSQGYDQLSEDSQEALDNTIKQLEANAEQQDQIVNMMLERLQTHYTDAYGAIQDIISSTGTVIGDVAESSINQLETTADKIISLARAMDEFQTQASATANNINTSTITTADSAVKTVEATIKANNTDATIANAKASTTPSGAATPNIISAGAAVANVEAERAKAAAAAAAKAATTTAKAATTTAATATKTATTTSTTLDKIKQFVNSKLQLNKKQSTSKLSALGKYIFQKSGGRVLTQTTSWELARLLGIAGTPSTLAAWNKLSASKKDSIKKLTLAAVKKAGYKKGVLNLNEDELAWTNEDWKKDGSELIVSKRDGAILTPLKAGDSVIPANLAENLFKWGAIDPSMLHDKFVSKLPNISSMSTTMQAPVTIESIITVNGNVDESVMPQLEELGKQLANNLNFQRDMTKVISHNLYKDAKKQGYRK